MGTDIELFVETYDAKSNRWQIARGLRFDARQYDVFACLAGVRNRVGVEPILPGDRSGFPSDLSPEGKLMTAAHTRHQRPGWVLLSEALNTAYWGKWTTEERYVSLDHYLAYLDQKDHKGSPLEYFVEAKVPLSEAVGSKMCVKPDHVRNAAQMFDKSCYSNLLVPIGVQNVQRYQDIIAATDWPDFVSDVQDHQLSLSLLPREVRLVFWFES